jgi:hypothetical protein
MSEEESPAGSPSDAASGFLFFETELGSIKIIGVVLDADAKSFFQARLLDWKRM